MVEGDLADPLLNLEQARRLVRKDCHDGGFDRRTARLDARHFLDDDRDILRESEILPHPISDLIERNGETSSLSSRPKGSRPADASPLAPEMQLRKPSAIFS